MNYRLTDEDYAVLDYIRSRNGTHIDHLNTVFGYNAEPAVIRLEKFGLIDPDFPNADVYVASDLGKTYRHNVYRKSESNEESRIDDLYDNPTGSQRERKPFYKSEVFWTIIGIAVAAIIGVIQIVFR